MVKIMVIVMILIIVTLVVAMVIIMIETKLSRPCTMATNALWGKLLWLQQKKVARFVNDMHVEDQRNLCRD